MPRPVVFMRPIGGGRSLPPPIASARAGFHVVGVTHYHVGQPRQAEKAVGVVGRWLEANHLANHLTNHLA